MNQGYGGKENHMNRNTIGDIGGYIDENWRGGALDMEIGPAHEMPTEVDIQPVDEGVPAGRASVWDWRSVLKRELMRGKCPEEILRKYDGALRRFGAMDDAVYFLKKNFGVLGWLVVDVSCLDGKFRYQDMPEDIRQCNLFAVNSPELREIVSRKLVDETDGSFDGFIGGGDRIVESIRYVDEATGLPALDVEGGLEYDELKCQRIAKTLSGRGWMLMQDYDACRTPEERIHFIVAAIRDHFAPYKGAADGSFEDGSAEYGLEGQSLVADSCAAEPALDTDALKAPEQEDFELAAPADDFGELEARDDLGSGDFEVEPAAAEGSAELDGPEMYVGIDPERAVQSLDVDGDSQELTVEFQGLGPDAGDVKLEHPVLSVEKEEANPGTPGWTEAFSPASRKPEFEFSSPAVDAQVDDWSRLDDGDIEIPSGDSGGVDEEEFFSGLSKGEVKSDKAMPELVVDEKYDWSW